MIANDDRFLYICKVELNPNLHLFFIQADSHVRESWASAWRWSVREQTSILSRKILPRFFSLFSRLWKHGSLFEKKWKMLILLIWPEERFKKVLLKKCRSIHAAFLSIKKAKWWMVEFFCTLALQRNVE